MKDMLQQMPSKGKFSKWLSEKSVILNHCWHLPTVTTLGYNAHISVLHYFFKMHSIIEEFLTKSLS